MFLWWPGLWNQLRVAAWPSWEPTKMFSPEASQQLAEQMDRATPSMERTRQLADILGYVEQLNEADTAGVEPTSHVLPLTNVLREDEPRACLPSAEALANAPDPDQGHFAVPKIIE